MSQSLQNVVKFQKFQLDNLVDFEKSCKTRIYLQNRCRYSRKRANFCQNLAITIPPPARASCPAWAAPRTRTGRQRAAAGRPANMAGLGFAKLPKLANLAKFCKFLAGWFSAVSKRTFATKCAFCSIFQALQDLHTFCSAPKSEQKNAKHQFEKQYIS